MAVSIRAISTTLGLSLKFLLVPVRVTPESLPSPHHCFINTHAHGHINTPTDRFLPTNRSAFRGVEGRLRCRLVGHVRPQGIGMLRSLRRDLAKKPLARQSSAKLCSCWAYILICYNFVAFVGLRGKDHRSQWFIFQTYRFHL